ncbi:hypothetical protein DL771_005461 [Monosporascus sp. 5C6A]|nr:hypothetical protein DL771_005461 [Monosporascus sp. 5C6A]
MGRTHRSRQPQPGQPSLPPRTPIRMSTSGLKSDPILGYKIRVLLHDLRNLAKDRAAEQRTLSTTDELYISGPYFAPEEVVCVKSAIVDTVSVDSSDHDENYLPVGVNQLRVEEAIHASLVNFFDKRRATGDSRPCGPHDMAPVFEAVFGISKEELLDEKFLSRLRRQGLPQVATSNPEESRRAGKAGNEKAR